MLKRLFHWEFPPLKHSYWLGINWGENAVAVYFGTAVFLFMSFVGIINFEPGLIFILIITVGFSLLLLAGIFEEISNPVRVDFDENQIQFIHLISRPKAVKITSLSEIRVETILKKPPANSKSKPTIISNSKFPFQFCCRQKDLILLTSKSVKIFFKAFTTSERCIN